MCACVFARVCESASVGACVCVGACVVRVCMCACACAYVCVCVSGCLGVSAYVVHLGLYVCVYVRVLVPV